MLVFRPGYVFLSWFALTCRRHKDDYISRWGYVKDAVTWSQKEWYFVQGMQKNCVTQSMERLSFSHIEYCTTLAVCAKFEVQWFQFWTGIRRNGKRARNHIVKQNLESKFMPKKAGLNIENESFAEWVSVKESCLCPAQPPLNVVENPSIEILVNTRVCSHSCQHYTRTIRLLQRIEVSFDKTPDIFEDGLEYISNSCWFWPTV